MAIPIILSAANKAKQKEASAIVASMIKAASAYQTEYEQLPSNMGDISEYARFQKCIANNIEIEGASICRNYLPVEVEGNDVLFYSSSGNYKVEMRATNTGDDQSIYQVKANPNGEGYALNGSAVVGCYKPLNRISVIKEYSSKANERGPQEYISCEPQPILPPNESIAFGPDSGLPCREVKPLPAKITNGYVYLSGRGRRSVPIVPVDISVGDKSWRVEGATAPISNTYNDDRWLEVFAEEVEAVINESEGEYSAEVDEANPGSIKIYGPSGNTQNDITMRIDNSERSRLSRGAYPYAVPALGNRRDNWDQKTYEIPDPSNEETTTVCDGR